MKNTAEKMEIVPQNNSPYTDEELQNLRHYLHQNPEVSWNEIKTANYILEYFEKHFKPDNVIRLAKHGIAFVFNGTNSGKTVLIRAELDALPIHETNDFIYKSKHDEVSHKCGHDGHMTILAGVAKHISTNRPKQGRVVLLYQPAEETGDGARSVYEDPNFEQIKPDIAFSLHNVPGKPMHQILCKTGSFTPSVKSMIIKLEGKTAHAAKPETGINPDLAIAEIIQTLHQINKSSEKGSLITLIHTLIGEKAYGISAGYGEIHFTMRGRSNEALQLIWDQMTEKVSDVAQQNELQATFDFTEEFMANTNDDAATQMIRNAAKTSGFNYVEMEEPNPWGEDFGFITSHVKGAMFGLGSGVSNPDLHNPDYDFPDELIETGKTMFVGLIDQALE